MNIQIFGVKKCFDTKKAQRWFKERGIRFQFVDLMQKEMSPGEFDAVCRAVGGMEALVNPKTGAELQYLALPEERVRRLREEPGWMRTPVVRNGRAATVGYCPEIWRTWQ